MAEKNINREFRLKDINKTRNYLIEVINGNEFTGKKHKKYLYNSKLYKKLSHFRFYNYRIYIYFFFCFFSWYSNRSLQVLQLD